MILPLRLSPKRILCSQDLLVLVCRILLGAFEGGLFPGFVTYFTMFYTRKEMALRTAYLFAMAAFAGATSGLLAYGIGFMDGRCRVHHLLRALAACYGGSICHMMLTNPSHRTWGLPWVALDHDS